MMRHSFFNSASGRRLSPVPLLLLAVCGLVAFVCLSVDLCADDYFYGTFLRDGFDSFVARNVEHYQTYNGRVQVHLLLQVVLHLGIPAYALACMAMLLLIPLLGRRAAGLGRETRLTVPLLFFLLLLLVGREVLREGLFWISACFNYLYPALLVVCAAALSRLALRARLPWFLLLCPAAFLCGATTEQCGVFSALILLALPLREAVRARRLRLPALLLPLCALGGYLTILSSPATQGRMRSGMNVAALWGQLDLLGGVIFGADGLFLLILAVLGLVFLSALLRPEFPRLGLGALPCAAALILLFHIPGLEAPARWAFLLTMGYCGLLAAALFFTASPCQGVLLAAGVGEAAIMAFTDTYGSRVLLPLALSLCLTGALLAAPLLPTLPQGARGPACAPPRRCASWSSCPRQRAMPGMPRSGTSTTSRSGRPTRRGSCITPWTMTWISATPPSMPTALSGATFSPTTGSPASASISSGGICTPSMPAGSARSAPGCCRTARPISPWSRS